MAAVLIELQRVLDVDGYGAVHICVGALYRVESGRRIVMGSSRTHCTPVADVFIDTGDAEYLLEFPVRDECCVEGYCPVEEFFVLTVIPYLSYKQD